MPHPALHLSLCRSGAVTIVLLLFCHHVSTPGTYLYEALPGTVTHGAAAGAANPSLRRGCMTSDVANSCLTPMCVLRPAVLEILAAVARLPVWLASTRVAWPFTRVLVLAYRLVHWLLISPLLLPFASLLSIPAVSLHAHFVRLPDWAKWTLMAAAGALGGSVALVSTVVIFVKSAFKPDKNAAPLQPRRWLRRRQEDLQQLVVSLMRPLPRPATPKLSIMLDEPAMCRPA